MVEYSHKIQEEVKAMQSEIKKNIQGTISEGKETGNQSNNLEKKEKSINQNKMKKQEFRKMRRGFRTSRTNLNIPTSES